MGRKAYLSGQGLHGRIGGPTCKACVGGRGPRAEASFSVWNGVSGVRTNLFLSIFKDKIGTESIYNSIKEKTDTVAAYSALYFKKNKIIATTYTIKF